MLKAIQDFSCEDFEYGTFDCCQFVGKCIEELTGKNPVDDYFYRSKRDALRLISGYGSLFELVCDRYGDPYPGAENGDLAIIDQDGKQILAVVYGSMIWAKTECGVAGFPLSDALYFWKVT